MGHAMSSTNQASGGSPPFGKLPCPSSLPVTRHWEIGMEILPKKTLQINFWNCMALTGRLQQAAALSGCAKTSMSGQAAYFEV